MDKILNADRIDNQQPRTSERYGYVYITTNLINGKKYLGVRGKSEFDVDYKGSGKVIQRAFKKYGWENFQCEILEWCNSREELFKREYELSIELDVVKNPNWYNCMYGGRGGDTHLNFTEEERKAFSEKCRAARVNRPRTENELAAYVIIAEKNRGKKRTPEQCKRISDALKGRTVTEEMRQHMRENHADMTGEKNPFYGRKHSEETKKLMGENHAKVTRGKIWITNMVDEQHMIYPKDLDKFPGFVRGKLRKRQIEALKEKQNRS